MSLEKDLSNIDWEKESTSLQGLLSKDVHMYRILMYTFIASSILFFFVYMIALIIIAPAAIYFWFATHKNKKGQPTGILFTLLKKECWDRPTPPFYQADDPESIDDSCTFYLFIPSTVSSYTSYIITESGLKQYSTNAVAKRFIVYEHIYDTFEEGQEIFFIFSPANDLIAYYLNGAITPLLATSTLKNGKEYTTSISLRQDALKNLNRDGFELLKPGEKPKS